MPKKVTRQQRDAVLHMLAQGQDRDTIAANVGVTPGQVSAISAHVTMGTYTLPGSEAHPQDIAPVAEPAQRTENLLRMLQTLEGTQAREDSVTPIHLGSDVENGDEVFWNPSAHTGAANPHVLILGESGFGKTYTIASLAAELTHQNIASIVFDYGQGFSPATLPPEFVAATNPIELHASRDGVNVNPLQIFPSDLHGPVNVAQRIADTFACVYKRIGVQQHAIVRQAVLDVMADANISPDAPESWEADLPMFNAVQAKLRAYADDPTNAHARSAASAASHISTVFVFNTFRARGQRLAWSELLRSGNRVIIIQLKGLEHSLERAVTEFLLWNLIGYIEALGPGPLRCFIILDEAHRLSFNPGSPVEKLLREGRKFGLGLILASQQPEDFGSVAFANTATKIVFQVGDERSAISRQLHRKVRKHHSFGEIYDVITKLPRGSAYVVTENVGRVVRITKFEDRVVHWSRARGR
ncbi:MAG: ATP-binding protein [Planctomycetes bacterium]|nr:ATP-binding protein [Planctomycetota bacterium]